MTTTQQDHDRRDRHRAVVQPLMGGLAVALLAALVIMMWQVIQDRQDLAQQVTNACARHDEAADQLHAIGACQEAAQSPPITDQVGRTGDPGAMGPTGPQGPAGPSGPPGQSGRDGIPGDAGTPGVPGLLGQTGSMGPVGPSGDVGPMGPQGEVGPVGPQGPAGPICPVEWTAQERTVPTADPMVTETWLVCVHTEPSDEGGDTDEGTG